MSAIQAFEPSAYRRSISEMFGGLDKSAQRELIESLTILPRHIHRLANEGRIAHGFPVAPTRRSKARTNGSRG